jgi:uncharacterized protein DUF3618
MSTGDTPVNGTGPEQLESDIARQREELAATVTELHSRLDVRARARDKVAELRSRATTPAGKPRPELAAGAAAAVVVLLAVALWRRAH